MPFDDTAISTDKDRDALEKDQHSGMNDVGKYLQLREMHKIYSDRLVVINNDPTGKRNEISSPAVLSAMLIIAEEERVKGDITITEGEPFTIQFPFRELMRGLQYEKQTKKLQGEIFIGGFQWQPDYHYLNGDVGIVSFDIEKDEVTMVIKPDLEKNYW